MAEHRLTDRNIEEWSATCVTCGKVWLKNNGRAPKRIDGVRVNVYRCSRRLFDVHPDPRTSKSRLHTITNVDVDNRLGDCLQCGRVDVYIGYKEGAWSCGPKNRLVVSNGDPKWRYGLRKSEAASLREGADCAVCGSTEDIRIDHNHETNKLRDTLCHKCNVSGGLLGEDIDRILRLAAYLQFHVDYPDVDIYDQKRRSWLDFTDWE